MVTGTVTTAPRLERTVISDGAGATPTCVYVRAPAGAGTPATVGRPGPMTPKPTSVSSAFGSLPDALTSRRDRVARQIVDTPVRVSVGIGLATIVIVVVAKADVHVLG